MGENEGFVRFRPEARRFYRALGNPQEVFELWEQLLFIADAPEVDFETVFEIPYEGDVYKVVYGPPFTIVFQNGPENIFIVRVISRAGF